MQSAAPFSLIGGTAHFILSALLPRSSSGQDAALSRLKQEFDSPTGRHRTPEHDMAATGGSSCAIMHFCRQAAPLSPLLLAWLADFRSPHPRTLCVPLLRADIVQSGVTSRLRDLRAARSFWIPIVGRAIHSK